MAKLGEGDARWVVTERADGQNVNAWHWTSKDATQLTCAALAQCLESPPLLGSASPLLQHCKLSKVAAKGECSVTTRKGRAFLLYELAIKASWHGELHGPGGAVLLESASGEVLLEDVSAECIDDLSVEFSTDARGSPLSEAMRKEGVGAIKRGVKQCMQILEQRITDSAESTAPSAARTAPAAPVKLPTDVATAAAHSVPKPTSQSVSRGSAKAADVDAEDVRTQLEQMELEKTLPMIVQLLLKKIRASCRGHVKHVRLAGCGLTDAHLPPILSLLYSSAQAIEELDLSFNRLTDEGAGKLLDALLLGGEGDELTRVHVGGNEQISDVARERMSTALRAKRPDLQLDWRPLLDGAQPCCSLHLVYKNSPAARAGLLKGDVVLQWGMLQKGRALSQRFGFQPEVQGPMGEAFLATTQYVDVNTSVAPIVRMFLGMPIDVIVRRELASPQVASGLTHECLKLRLTPERWSGSGLLGCVLR